MNSKIELVTKGRGRVLKIRGIFSVKLQDFAVER
jgi:hypothetical protein